MMRAVCVRFFGESRSFPSGETPFKDLVTAETAEVLILAGVGAGRALCEVGADGKLAALVELGAECLGEWTDESRGEEGSNIVGFNRFRLGHRAPSNLIELVKQPRTSQTAIDAAQQVMQAVGFSTAVCNDFPGGIVDRLVRPYFNSALQALDEQLASADDLDLTVRLGLGYPEGPIALLEGSGLAAHFEVTQALYEAYGEPALLPARRARVARRRARRQGS